MGERKRGGGGRGEGKREKKKEKEGRRKQEPSKPRVLSSVKGLGEEQRSHHIR